MSSATSKRQAPESCYELSDHQSLAVVKIFLNAAMACIAHTRELIPWLSSCFQTRYVGQLGENTLGTSDLYQNFCNRSAAADDRSQEFRILLRGKDRRADSILDFLENAIAETVNLGLLNAFQLFITADPTDPASVLETYTFSFSYHNDCVSSVSVVSNEITCSTVKSVQRSFSTAIRTLLRALTSLPRLPRQRSLGVSLLFAPNCPRDYQPHGFIDVCHNRPVPLRGSWSDIWNDMPTPVAEFDTGFRKITLGAQNLQDINRMTCSRLQDMKMSMQIQRLQKSSSQNEELEPTANSRPDANGFNGQKTGCIQVTNSQQCSLPAIDPDCVLSCSSATPQSSTNTANGLAKLSVASKNRRRRNVVASKLAELLVQARAMENNNQGSSKLFDKIQLENGKVKRLNRDGKIKCECGSRREATHMLLCEICGTRQHKVCYGYESLRQGCLPEEHFCYNCLLLPREDKVNNSMPDIVHMRLALLYLASRPTNQVEIGSEFSCSIFHESDNSTTQFLSVVDRLTREGYISPHKNGIARILDSNELLAEAQTTYLDPLAGVMHHYQIIRDGDTFEKRRGEVLRALKLYVGDREFSVKDCTNLSYDRVHLKDTYGQEAIRWGFYANWKRKRADTPEHGALRRKMSVANTFVNINRSSPSDNMSIDDALQEAIGEAEWSLRINSRLRSNESDLD